MATIRDKDVLIYAISQLVEALNRDRPISRTVQLKAYDLLVATNRHTGGKNYDRLADAFRRLKGTVVETDITTNGTRQRRDFGLIDSWEIIEKSPSNGRMVAIKLTLSEWLYNAVAAREVLTLSRDYFRLDGGVERRLYELARKHCGQQTKWAVGMELTSIPGPRRAAELREEMKRASQEIAKDPAHARGRARGHRDPGPEFRAPGGTGTRGARRAGESRRTKGWNGSPSPRRHPIVPEFGSSEKVLAKENGRVEDFARFLSECPGRSSRRRGAGCDSTNR